MSESERDIWAKLAAFARVSGAWGARSDSHSRDVEIIAALNELRERVEALEAADDLNEEDK